MTMGILCGMMGCRVDIGFRLLIYVGGVKTVGNALGTVGGRYGTR